MNIDDSIKLALKENTENINPNIDSFEKIKLKIKLNRSEVYMLRKKFLGTGFNMRKVVIAASCGILIAASSAALSPNVRKAVADTWIRNVYGYSSTKTYDTPQSNATLAKDAGFKVKVPETLTGGYKLIDTDIAGLVDGSSGKLEHKDKKELGAMYSKDGVRKAGFYVNLTESTNKLKAPDYKNIQKVTIGNKTAYFREYTILSFNNDSHTKPTKQDFDDQENGKVLVICVSARKGSEGKVKIPDKTSTIAHELSWSDNGTNYVLSEEGYGLGLNELSNIAKDVINLK